MAYFLNKIRILELMNKGLSQAEMAKELNCSISSIGKYSQLFGISWLKGPRDQSGEKNPRWSGGGVKVKNITERVLKEAGRDLHTCERCSFKTSYQQPRHHKDRNRANNNLSNLEVLCHSCHALEHTTDRERDTEGRFI